MVCFVKYSQHRNRFSGVRHTDQAVQTLAFLTCIPELSGSNIDRDTNNSDFLHAFTQSIQVYAGKIPKIESDCFFLRCFEFIVSYHTLIRRS